MGKKRLEDAIQKIEHPIEVVYRSFELDPLMERNVPQNMYEKLAEKYRISLEQAKENCRKVTEMAKDVGLDYQFDSLILTNTFDAHRLALFAKNHGLMQEMIECLLRAYFTESKHIGDHETLVALSMEVGLNTNEVEKMLASNEMSDDVRADEQEAAEFGIRSVPFFLINRKYAITGAQPTEVFVQSLQQIIEKDGLFKQTGDHSGPTCDESGCEIPEKTK